MRAATSPFPSPIYQRRAIPSLRPGLAIIAALPVLVFALSPVNTRAAAAAPAPAAPASAASEPPVVLPAMSVMESAMKIKIVTSYFHFSVGGAFATSMMVTDVKTPSFAQEAGLQSGMEIVAIQGKRVGGQSPGSVERLLRLPTDEPVVLTVRRPGKRRTEELTIPVRPPPPPPDPKP